MPPRHPARDPLNERIRQERIEWARSLPVGQFEGRYSLDWIGPDLFRLWWPDQSRPFRFIRANGEVYQPPEMTTDGGTIAPILQVFSGITRWQYGHAVVIHDGIWEVRDSEPVADFETSNLILAEAMRTMQVMGIVPDRPQDIVTVYQAVMSPIARAMWDGR